MMHVYDLPALNAVLNSISTVLILIGWWMIRREQKLGHGVCMGLALLTSAAFLTSYLIYHYYVGSVKFTAQGFVRPVYFFILITHLILAIVNLPMLIGTVWAAATQRWERHRRWAKWTLPVWLYVSITGVVVYFMLYQWFPPEEVLQRALR